MKKFILRAIFFALIALLVLIVTGCGQTDEANSLISKANKHIDKGNSLQKDINRLLDQIDKSKVGKKTLKLCKQFESKAKAQQQEAQQSLVFFKKASKLDISESFKKYIDLEVKASQANLASIKTKVKLASILVRLWQTGLNKTLSQQKANALEKQADSLANAGAAQENQYNKLHHKASAFRKKELTF